MYENKPEFPAGGGGAKQKPSMGEVWMFSGTAQSKTGISRGVGGGWIKSKEYIIASCSFFYQHQQIIHLFATNKS